MNNPDILAENVVVVLNETQDLVNVAGSARAMMNMGLRRLRLVQPAEYDERRITGIAHGAEVILERIEFPDTLDAALADAVHVVGTTARRRADRHVWEHPREAAPDLVRRAADERGPVALVFGREDVGLTNEQLDRCDRILTVPTDRRRSSLNLAQAVLVIAYELRMAGPGASVKLPRPRRDALPASSEQFQRLFEDMERALDRIDFYSPRNPDIILRTFRAIYRRADLDVREANLVRSMFIEFRKYIERLDS
jgi:TrmH family RNA methyltransferase